LTRKTIERENNTNEPTNKKKPDKAAQNHQKV